MKLDWRELQSADKVRATIERAVPIGSSEQRVREFMAEQEIECSATIDGIMYGSAPAKSRLPFTRAKWLLRIHLANDHVDRIEAELGLIGP